MVDGGSQTNILVIDDDPVSLLVASHILIGAGYNVSATEEPSRARELLNTEAFDAVLCDYLMPDETGLDLLEWLRTEWRADSGCGIPPFVLLTGFADKSDLVDDRLELVSEFLTKPVQSSELLATMARVAPTD